MGTLASLVATGRERDGVAVDVPDRSAPHSYRELCTNVWKAGNLLGHYTHPGGTVAVVIGPKATSGSPAELVGGIDSADPVLAVLGGTLLGATVTVTPGTPVDADILVRPAGPGWREAYPTRAGCSVLAYGGPPEPSSVEQFEAALWSENPIAPPESVDPETPALRVDNGTHTHGDLRAAAAAAVDRLGLDPSSRVLPAGDWRAHDVLVPGVLAPLSVGATVLVDDDASATHILGGTEGRKD